MIVRIRATVGFVSMVVGMAALGVQASIASAPNGMTVLAAILFGSGLLGYISHRAERNPS